VNSRLYPPVAVFRDEVAGNHWTADGDGPTEGLYAAIGHTKMSCSPGYEIRAKYPTTGNFTGSFCQLIKQTNQLD
jgi:hypothetical protein